MTQDELFEKVCDHKKRGLPLVCYSFPGELEVTCILQDNTEHYCCTDYTESGFVFAPFNPDEKNFYIPTDHAQMLHARIPGKGINESKTGQLLEREKSDETAKKEHIRLVEEGLSAIEKGVVQKVVLSRQEKLSVKSVDPVTTYKKLLGLYPDSFTYLWMHPKTGTWMGATPESLFQLNGQVFSTMSLAGTRTVEEVNDGEWTDKEMAEQQYVTDFIKDQLEPLTEDLFISERRTHRAGNLLHLKNEISGSLKDDQYPIKDLVKALHPTPAVCGLPRKEALEFILKNEVYNREFYTGFAGEMNILNQGRQRTRLFVNLRCLRLFKDEVLLFVGGGVTDKSRPEDEWNETVAKSQTVKRSLI